MIPENSYVRDPLIHFLRFRGFHSEIIHCDEYQKGLPDFVCCSKEHGFKWVETKYEPMYPRVNPCFTVAQKNKFPILIKAGYPVYIIVGIADLKNKKNQFLLDYYLKLILGEPNGQDFLPLLLKSS